jgi:UbiD family decarboxylase
VIYRSLEECVLDLERNKQLVRIREEVDPNLEMAEIHRRVYQAGGLHDVDMHEKGNCMNRKEYDKLRKFPL